MTVGVTRYTKELSFAIKPAPYKAIITDLLRELASDISKSAKLRISDVGTIGVYTNRNTFSRTLLKRAISFQKLKEIKARGGVPRQPIKDDDGKVVAYTDGEEWRVFHSVDMLCQIKLDNRNSLFVKDKYIKFVPHREFSKKVYDFIESNPLKESAYETNYK